MHKYHQRIFLAGLHGERFQLAIVKRATRGFKRLGCEDIDRIFRNFGITQTCHQHSIDIQVDGDAIFSCFGYLKCVIVSVRKIASVFINRHRFIRRHQRVS